MSTSNIASDVLLEALIAYASRQHWQLMARTQTTDQYHAREKINLHIQRPRDLEALFSDRSRPGRIELPFRVKLFLKDVRSTGDDKTSSISGAFGVPDNPGRAKISNWTTASSARSQGAGRLLMDIFLRLAHDFGLSTCELFACPPEGPNRVESFQTLYRTYEAVGFVLAPGEPHLTSTAASRNMVLHIPDYHTSVSLAVGKIVKVSASSSGTGTLVVGVRLHVQNHDVDLQWPAQAEAPVVGKVVKLLRNGKHVELYPSSSGF